MYCAAHTHINVHREDACCIFSCLLFTDEITLLYPWTKENGDENKRRALQKLREMIHYIKENFFFNLLFSEKMLMIVFDRKPTLLQQTFQTLHLIGEERLTQLSGISLLKSVQIF